MALRNGGHRTIKRMAARTGKLPEMMTFWYNLVEKSELSVSPAEQLFVYKWRHPCVPSTPPQPVEHSLFAVGDAVVYKTPDKRSTSPWNRGQVTQVNSSNSLDVDGIAQHVLDLRLCVEPADDTAPVTDAQEPVNAEVEVALMPRATHSPAPARPQRERCLPARFRGYEL